MILYIRPKRYSDEELLERRINRFKIRSKKKSGMLDEEFVSELINRRLELKITQQKLAGLVRTSQGQISAIETGRTTPTVRELNRIAKVLNCKIILKLHTLTEKTVKV